jgi:hypothetical protein
MTDLQLDRMTPQPPRCGDRVLHRPSGEGWLVAFADAEHDDIAWAGWPDGRARLSDCDVTYRCSDAEHRQAVLMWAKSKGGDNRRAAVMQRYGAAIQESPDAA